MNQTPRHRAVKDSSNSTDARWLTEWIEFGLRQFETYLEKHRRFDDYYAGRNHCADLGGQAN